MQELLDVVKNYYAFDWLGNTKTYLQKDKCSGEEKTIILDVYLL